MAKTNTIITIGRIMVVLGVRLDIRLQKTLISNYMIKRCWKEQQKKAESAKSCFRHMMRSQQTVSCILW